jgi:nucleotide-binding universal stress UspA family protein
VKELEPGQVLDGFLIGERIETGPGARFYRVSCTDGRSDPGFPLLMKLPQRQEADGAERSVIPVDFEVEQQSLQALSGPHVPRLVAAGDPAQQPWLVMEFIEGRTLQYRTDQPALPALSEVVYLGAALALAVHSLHQQNAVHQDLQPAHVLVRADGSVVLLDFGLCCHAHYPDLQTGQERRALGTPAWMAPEQVLGVRGDPRSDVFAIGVILYQLLTHALPYGKPDTPLGLRQRLWRDPLPPRQLRPDIPAWLQEVVLRCLAPEAAQRYPSAAHLAFDLQHPQQVRVSARGDALRPLGLWAHAGRWLRAQRMRERPSPPPQRLISEVPIVLVAVPPEGASDAMLYALRQAAQRALGTRPGARLACVTVVLRSSTEATHDPGGARRRYMAQLQHWAQPLQHPQHQIACRVLESGDVADALLAYAREHRVSVIVMGAATPGLQIQRFITTVPLQVAMDAPCTVIFVKQTLPFEPPGSAGEPEQDD